MHKFLRHLPGLYSHRKVENLYYFVFCSPFFQSFLNVFVLGLQPVGGSGAGLSRILLLDLKIISSLLFTLLYIFCKFLIFILNGTFLSEICMGTDLDPDLRNLL